MDISPELFAIVGAAIALAALIIRSTSRTDRLIERTVERTDRRIDRLEDAMAAFRASMDDFRAEMHRLAERQSHLEGRIDKRGAAAD